MTQITSVSDDYAFSTAMGALRNMGYHAAISTRHEVRDNKKVRVFEALGKRPKGHKYSGSVTIDKKTGITNLDVHILISIFTNFLTVEEGYE